MYLHCQRTRNTIPHCWIWCTDFYVIKPETETLRTEKLSLESWRTTNTNYTIVHSTGIIVLDIEKNDLRLHSYCTTDIYYAIFFFYRPFFPCAVPGLSWTSLGLDVPAPSLALGLFLCISGTVFSVLLWGRLAWSASRSAWLKESGWDRLPAVVSPVLPGVRLGGYQESNPDHRDRRRRPTPLGNSGAFTTPYNSTMLCF